MPERPAVQQSEKMSQCLCLFCRCEPYIQRISKHAEVWSWLNSIQTQGAGSVSCFTEIYIFHGIFGLYLATCNLLLYPIQFRSP